MKRSIFLFFVIINTLSVLTGCSFIPESPKSDSGAQTGAAVETTSTVNEIRPTLTSTWKPTHTLTLMPTLTETPVPTATPLAFNLGGAVIDADNAAELEVLDTLGKGMTTASWLDDASLTDVIKTSRGLFLYDRETMAEITFLEDYQEFYFIPEEPRMAALSPENTLQIIDLKDGDILQELTAENVVSVYSVGFSSDGEMMAVSVAQEHETRKDYIDHRIDVWDVEENTLVSQLHTDLVQSCSTMAFSPDHSHLISKCGGYIFYWDIDEKSIIWSLRNEGSILADPFSRDGEYVAVNTNAEVYIRYASNGNLVGRVPGKLSPGAFSPDGKHIVTSSFSLIRVWNVFTSLAEKKIQTELDWPSVSYSKDGKHILANDGFLAWRTEDYELDPDYPRPEALIEPISSTQLSSMGFLSGIRDIIMLEDKSLFIWGFNEGYIEDSKIWRFDPGKEIYKEIAVGITRGEPAMSPMLDKIAVCTQEGLKLINIQDGEEEIVRPCHKGYTSLAFSKDAKKLYGNYGVLIDVIDLETGESVSQLRGHAYDVGAIRISEDGNYLFSTSQCGANGGFEVNVWELDPPRRLQRWTLPTDYYAEFADAFFSKDGSKLIALYNEVTVWRISDGWYLENLPGSAAGLSPDGALAAVTSTGTSFQFYDPTDWSFITTVGRDKEFAPLPFMDFYGYTPFEGAKQVKFLNEGRLLACVSDSDVIELWGIP
jgi:WD40 repeat protein